MRCYKMWMFVILFAIQASWTVCLGQKHSDYPFFCKYTFKNHAPDTEGSATGPQKLSVECYGNNTDFQQAVHLLPDDISEFTFTIVTTPPQIQTVDIGLPEIARFQNLSIFRIQPKTQERYFEYALVSSQEWPFCQLTSLEELHLNVLMYEINSSSVACLTQEHFHTFNLSYVRRLRSETTELMLASLPLTTLKKLVLRNIQDFEREALTRLNFSLFRRSNKPKLEELDFSYNDIAGVNPGLWYLPKLKKLDLSGNHIFGLYSHDIQSILTYFQILVHPSLEEVSGSFQGFSNSRQKHSVGLAYVNQIQKIQAPCVDSSWKITSLLTNRSRMCDVFHCLAGDSEINTFDTCAGLIQDALEETADPGCWLGIHTPVSKILKRGYASSVTTFSSITPDTKVATYCLDPNNSVEEIDVSNNRIGEFFEIPEQMNDLIVTGLQQLKYLNLENNGIKLSNPKPLAGFPAMETLLLGNNQLVVDRNLLFESMPKLRILDLSWNGIANISAYQFSSLRNLERLDLSGNQLSVIGFALPNSTSMELFNLSNNLMPALTSSDIELLGDVGPNVSVDMRGNPLVCDCGTADFVTSVQTGKTLNFIEKDQLICYHPGQYQAHVMTIDVHALKKSCQSTFLKTVVKSVSYTLLAVIIAFTVLVLFRKRWMIRYFLYRYQRLHDEDIPPDPDDDYEWDAFVAYSSVNRNWVHFRLQEEMEENRGYKMFMYGRDILPNENLVQRLEETIDNCRKAILVLTPEFLASDHCLYDAVMADTRLQHEGRDIIILVKLKNLPISGIPRMIARLLDTKDCLEWTDDVYGQRLFWEKLEKQLNIPSQNPMRQ